MVIHFLFVGKASSLVKQSNAKKIAQQIMTAIFGGVGGENISWREKARKKHEKARESTRKPCTPFPFSA